MVGAVEPTTGRATGAAIVPSGRPDRSCRQYSRVLPAADQRACSLAGRVRQGPVCTFGDSVSVRAVIGGSGYPVTPLDAVRRRMVADGSGVLEAIQGEPQPYHRGLETAPLFVRERAGLHDPGEQAERLVDLVFRGQDGQPPLVAGPPVARQAPIDRGLLPRPRSARTPLEDGAAIGDPPALVGDGHVIQMWHQTSRSAMLELGLLHAKEP